MMKAGDGEKRLTEILKATKLGLWIIEIDTNKDEYRMFVDESMSDILGVKGEDLSRNHPKSAVLCEQKCGK